MKKVIFSLSLLALTTAAFAETKTETPSKTEGTAKLSVYYVTGIDNNNNYTLSTSPNPLCGEGEQSPCEITSENPISAPLKAPKSQVDAETNGFSILERQPEL